MNNVIQTITNLINQFMQSEYLNIASFALAIISISLALIFHRKGKRIIKLGYIRFKYTVLDESSNKFNKLEIAYDGESLKSFSVTELTIKNYGNVSIKKEDIAPSNPITINCPEGKKILAHEVVYESNEDNAVDIFVINENTSKVTFDFLNPKDKFLIRVLHTGNEEDILRLTGAVIGESAPFSDQKTSKKFVSGFESFIMGYLRLMISPKLKWVRVVLDYTIGISLLSYAFLGKPGIIGLLLCIIFGSLILLGGTIKIFSKKKDSTYDDKERFEHMLNSQMQNTIKNMKSTFFENLQPNKANSTKKTSK